MQQIFKVSDLWKSTFPGASVGILVMRQVTNPATCEPLEAQKQALESEIRQRFSGGERSVIKMLPTIQAYNNYYRPFKKSYHVQLQLESIAFKGKSIPSVASLVEAMFMAEVKNMLLTAGHDLDVLQLPLTLKVSDGNEQYVILRGLEQPLAAGDMYITDTQGIISSIIYGPDQRTHIRTETRNALFVVYAPAGIDPQAVSAHLQDISRNVRLVTPQAQEEILHVFRADD